jgi:hypothetical protein
VNLPRSSQTADARNPTENPRKSCLAIWNWLFGTLHLPAKERERLSFGVEPTGRDEQTITEAYIAPVHRAAAHVRAAAAMTPTESGRLGA